VNIQATLIGWQRYGIAVRRVLIAFRTKVLHVVFPLAFRVHRRGDMVRLGTDYGGWWVPSSLVTSEWICYFVGVGTDVSFDTALIERFGCLAWGIDPTPRTIEWVTTQQTDPRWVFVPIGVAGASGELRFYAPENPEHVSHSIKNPQRTTTYFTAEVLTIADLMRRLGHPAVDLLKLDIEGAEHETIRQMLNDGIRPRVLCVEFDQPEPLSWGRQTATALRRAGYELVKVDGFNLTFVLGRPQS
jgi:FkbM family methyltransferase